MSKLHIPTPEQENPNLAFLECIVITLLVCAVGLYGAMQNVLLVKPSAAAQRAAAREAARTPEERRIEQLRKLPDLSAHQWDRLDLVSALRFGPLDLAQQACERWLALSAQDPPGLSPDDDRAIAAELLSVLDRRVKHAPLACVLRAHLRGELTALSELDREAAVVWGEVSRFEYEPTLVGAAVRHWQVTRQRPDTPAFDAWLRVCGMGAISPERLACQDMLRQLAPRHGSNLLETIDLHISQLVPLHVTDLKPAAEALALIASIGQPPRFADLESDQEIRRAAVFLLCRIVHHPDQAIGAEAGRWLSFVAGIDARSSDRHTRARWQDACRLIFGGTRAPHEPGEAPNPTSPVPDLELDPIHPQPSLAAWKAAAGERCPADRAAWRCAAALPWILKADDRRLELRTLYVETRHIEWGEDWFDAVEVWEIEKKRRAKEAAKNPPHAPKSPRTL
jgi:hypothetical protein